MLDNWHNMAKKLSEHFTVYSVDVRNHGSSPHHPSMTYEKICNDFSELLHDLNLPHAHFVGHSMGGKAVMKLADLHPELIDKLCVVDIAPKRYKPGHLALFEAMFNLPVETITSRKEAENILSESIKDVGIRLFILKNIDRRNNGGYAWKMGLDNIYKNYETIIDEVRVSWPFSNDALFIKGENSNYISSEDESNILEYFPNAEFETIPNAGHWVHAENPEAFYTALETFLL